MDRSKLLFLTDSALGLAFLLVFLTGIVKFFYFVGYPLPFSSLVPHELNSFVHAWSGFAFVLFALVHIALHAEMYGNLLKNFFRRP